MKLPDFSQDASFNKLREKMDAPYVEWHSDQKPKSENDLRKGFQDSTKENYESN